MDAKQRAQQELFAETEKFARQNILCMATMLVEAALKGDEASLDEVYELCMESARVEAKTAATEDFEGPPHEIYEWYALESNWIGDKLKAKGEIIYENWGHVLWGRCGTGQSIALDHVWQEIYLDVARERDDLTSEYDGHRPPPALNPCVDKKKPRKKKLKKSRRR